MPPRHEPLLEREVTVRRLDPRPQPVVGGGQQRRLDPECLGQPGGHGRQRLAPRERLRADEVQAEVAVAEHEPALPSKARGLLERDPALVRAPPSALRVGDAGERVEDAVQIGRDVHAEHLDVVADVADHRHVRRIRGLREPAQKPSTADAARERHDLHARTLSA